MSDWQRRRAPFLPPHFWARPTMVASAALVAIGAAAGAMMRPDSGAVAGGPSLPMWVTTLIPGACMVAVAAGVLMAALSDRHARLAVRDGAFVAGVGRTPAALCVIGAVPAAMAVMENALAGPINAVRWAFLGIESIALVMLWAPILIGRPRLALCPEGLIVVGLAATRWVPWEALDPTVPLRPGHALPLARPELVNRRGLGARHRGPNPWWGWLANDAHLVRNMVVFYLAHPDYRSAIGSVEEWEDLPVRLDRWLVDWFASDSGSAGR